MDEPINSNNPGDGEVKLLDYFIVLAKYSRMIIIASVALTVLTYLYLFCSPNEYNATARIMPPQQNLTLSAQILESLGGRFFPGAGGAGAGGGLGGLAAGFLGLKSPGDMYVAMMASETVADHIIDRFHLMKLYKSRYRVDARMRLGKSTKFTAGKKDGIIIIQVTDTSPKLAAEIANAYIEELGRLLHRLALQEAKGRMDFLEKERLQASQHLTQAEESVRRFSEKNSVLQIDTQTRGAIEYVARLRAEIDTREVGMQVLRQQATPLNYDMVRLETEIKGLKDKLHSAESQLDNCVGDVCLPTGKTPSLSLEYLRLFREAKFQEGLYQLYNKLVEIARLDMAREVAVIHVLTPAKPPEKRFNKRLSPAILAGVITFFMMIFVAFVQEYMRKVKSRDDEVRRYVILKEYLRPWGNMVKGMKNTLSFKKKL